MVFRYDEHVRRPYPLANSVLAQVTWHFFFFSIPTIQWSRIQERNFFDSENFALALFHPMNSSSHSTAKSQAVSVRTGFARANLSLHGPSTSLPGPGLAYNGS